MDDILKFAADLGQALLKAIEGGGMTREEAKAIIEDAMRKASDAAMKASFPGEAP
jgi:hypothetical protein